MTILDERDDVAVSLVHRNATRLKTGLGYDDIRPPGLAAILAAPGANVAGAPRGNDRALHRDHDVTEALIGEQRLDVKLGLAQMRLQRAFSAGGGLQVLASRQEGAGDCEQQDGFFHVINAWAKDAQVPPDGNGKMTARSGSTPPSRGQAGWTWRVCWRGAAAPASAFASPARGAVNSGRSFPRCPWSG